MECFYRYRSIIVDKRICFPNVLDAQEKVTKWHSVYIIRTKLFPTLRPWQVSARAFIEALLRLYNITTYEVSPYSNDSKALDHRIDPEDLQRSHRLQLRSFIYSSSDGETLVYTTSATRQLVSATQAMTMQTHPQAHQQTWQHAQQECPGQKSGFGRYFAEVRGRFHRGRK